MTQGKTTKIFSYELILNTFNQKNNNTFYGKVYADDEEKALEKVTEFAETLGEKIYKSVEEIGNRSELVESIKPFNYHTNCKVEKVEVKKDSILDDAYNHWGESRTSVLDMINEIWCDKNGRERLKVIIGAYWERDKEEIADRYSEECAWWRASEMNYEQAIELVGFDDIAHEWLNYVADDLDLKAIINYVRPLNTTEDWVNVIIKKD